MGEVLSVRRWCLLSMTGYGGDPVPTPLPFWLKPVGTFGLFIFTTLPRVHMCSPYHASDPISAWCWQIHRSLAVLMPVWMTVGVLSEGIRQRVTLLPYLVGYC